MTEKSIGKFIVFEGIDGAGTTTHSIALARWLKSIDQPAIWTMEPSSGSIGQDIRRRLASGDGVDDARMMALLFAADRADHLKRVIEPAVAAGIHVVCDRYAYSNVAYQGARQDEAFAFWIKDVNDPFLDPDLAVFLQVPLDVAAARRAERGGIAEAYEDSGFLSTVADLYEVEDVYRRQMGGKTLTLQTEAAHKAVQRRCQTAVAELIVIDPSTVTGALDIPTPTPQQALVLKRAALDPSGSTTCSITMAGELVDAGLAIIPNEHDLKGTPVKMVAITDLGRAMIKGLR